MEFFYDGVTNYNQSIEIDNPHQVCLKASDNMGFDYYLIIRTLLGECSTIEYGPLVEGDPVLPDSTSIKFERFESDEYKLKKKIKTFLSPRNKGKNKITQVTEVPFESALDAGIDIIGYMRGFSEESNY